MINQSESSMEKYTEQKKPYSSSKEKYVPPKKIHESWRSKSVDRFNKPINEIIKDEIKKELSNLNDLSNTNHYGKNTPFYITVMGENGKILVNVVKSTNSGRTEVQVFFNKGNYKDGHERVKQCLLNMLSNKFENIVAIDATKGHYLAIQPTHNQDCIHWYRTNHKYKSNIGTLDFVDIDRIHEFADLHEAFANPVIQEYFESVKIFIETCKTVANEFDCKD